MKKLYFPLSFALGIAITIYLLKDRCAFLALSRLISSYGLDMFELSDLRHLPRAFILIVITALFGWIFHTLSKEMSRPKRGLLDISILGALFLWIALTPAVQDGPYDILPFSSAIIAIFIGVDLLSLYPFTPIIGIPVTITSLFFIILEMPRALSFR